MPEPELPEEEEAAVRESVKNFDKDRTGLFRANDFARILRLLGNNPSEKEVAALRGELDPDGSGMISTNDMLRLLARHQFPKDTNQDLINALGEFDHDGDGKIKVSELKAVLMSMGEQLNHEEFLELVRVGDPNGSGFVNIKTFANLVITK